MSENDEIAIDFEIEEFYLGFKTSMINFYRNHSFKRPIKEWSITLNQLQKQKKYVEIQDKIKNIISLYAIDIMRTYDIYNMGILITNIKRWNRISEKYIDLTGTKEINIVFILLDIFNSLCTKDTNDCEHLFIQIELYLLYKDFTELIKFSVENNRFSVLDKLINYDKSIFSKILDIYNIPNHKPKNIITGRKLVKLITMHNMKDKILV
jgi:hypothetical protein